MAVGSSRSSSRVDINQFLGLDFSICQGPKKFVENCSPFCPPFKEPALLGGDHVGKSICFFFGGVLTFFSALLLRNSTVKGSNLPQFCKKIFFLGKNSSDVKTSDVGKPDFGGSFSGFGKTILLTTDPRFWGVSSFSLQGALPLKKVSRNKWH